mmetsp:Transcript_5638/g.23904  ORF Transcript_5638/g.23904 Transcript_5638/m.23904 type:complete len:213 (-) Transcript_5638:15-653(-)
MSLKGMWTGQPTTSCPVTALARRWMWATARSMPPPLPAESHASATPSVAPTAAERCSRPPSRLRRRSVSSGRNAVRVANGRRQSLTRVRSVSSISACSRAASRRVGCLYSTGPCAGSSSSDSGASPALRNRCHREESSRIQLISEGREAACTLAHMLSSPITSPTSTMGMSWSRTSYDRPVAAFTSTVRLPSSRRRSTYDVSPSGTPRPCTT